MPDHAGDAAKLPKLRRSQAVEFLRRGDQRRPDDRVMVCPNPGVAIAADRTSDTLRVKYSGNSG
jgi:hypothetical protein